MSSKLLMEKGRKAWFKIKKTIGLNNPCSLIEKLFDTLVSPIILYGCEIWGVDSSFKDSDPFEHLHIKFIKEILGVHCKASNAACLAELNRYPLKGKIQFLTIKFLDHISSSNNTLVNKIYTNTDKNNKWLTTVQKWTRNLGFEFLNANTQNIKPKIAVIQQRINDQAIQNQHSVISENKKLDFFQKVYKFNKRPPYVDICKFKADRSVLCKYRISAHSLSIEKGRHKNIQRSNRICNACNTGQIEDEIHFFLNCPTYDIIRKELIQKIKKPTTTFDLFTENQLTNLLNSNSLPMLKAIIDYINKCQTKVLM